ncbi:hypothetical protein ES703_107657 [subsurface metagenome]
MTEQALVSLDFLEGGILWQSKDSISISKRHSWLLLRSCCLPWWQLPGAALGFPKVLPQRLAGVSHKEDVHHPRELLYDKERVFLSSLSLASCHNPIIPPWPVLDSLAPSTLELAITYNIDYRTLCQVG